MYRAQKPCASPFPPFFFSSLFTLPQYTPSLSLSVSVRLSGNQWPKISVNSVSYGAEIPRTSVHHKDAIFLPEMTSLIATFLVLFITGCSLAAPNVTKSTPHAATASKASFCWQEEKVHEVSHCTLFLGGNKGSLLEPELWYFINNSNLSEGHEQSFQEKKRHFKHVLHAWNSSRHQHAPQKTLEWESHR